MAKQWPYRCQNPLCAGKPDFWVDAGKDPACPGCEISITDERFKSLITPVAILHFDPPSHVPGFGRGYWACNPAKAVVVNVGRDRATGDPLVVTCPACKETAAYASAMGDPDAVAKLDFHAIKATFGKDG